MPHVLVGCSFHGFLFQPPQNAPAPENPVRPQPARPQPAPAVEQPELNMVEELQKVKMQNVAYALTQLKTLAASNAPDQSLLIALDMLVEMATDSDHPDLSLYQSLRAQATRMQDRLCIKGLCLEVLTTKENDKVSNAVQKLLKEEKSKKVEKPVKKEEPAAQPSPVPAHPLSPIQGYMQAPSLYPMHQQYPGMGYPTYPGYPMQQGYQNFPMQHAYPQSYRGKPRRGGSNGRNAGNGNNNNNNSGNDGHQRGNTACHFCGMEGHFIRECQQFKKCRDNNSK